MQTVAQEAKVTEDRVTLEVMAASVILKFVISAESEEAAKVLQSTMGTVRDRMVKWLILVGHSALLRRCA